MPTRLICGLSGAVTVLVTATAGFAQVPEVQAPEAQAVADVVVTARLRPETVQQAPLAVRPISSETIRQIRPLQLSDLSGSAPNFRIERLVGLETVLIRGAGGGGRTIGFSPRTAVYLDGVYIALPSALNRSLADAERVEVLRGPQGVLFGRNTVSGAVSIVGREPSATPGAEGRLWAGSRKAFGAFASADLPLDRDRVLLHLSALRETRDGFTTNLHDGSKDVGSIDLQSYRAVLRLQATPRLRLDLSGDYGLDRSQRDGFEAVSNPVGAGNADPFAPAAFEIDENTPRLRRNEQAGASLTAAYSLPGGGTATSITAYRFTGADRRSDNDYSPLDLLSTDYRDRFRQASEELRLAWDRGRLSYVAGLFYLHEAARSDRRALFGADTARAGLPVPPGGVVPADARIDSDSAAAFANVDYRVLPQWTLSAGLRLTREERRLRFDLDGTESGALRIATLDDFRDKAVEKRATPAVSLSYSPSKALTLYGRYAEGFKSGGWNADFLNVGQVVPLPGSKRTPFAFGPETVQSYEVGLKARFWGGRARMDLTAFTMDFRGYQTNKLIAYPNGLNVIQLTNASSARSSGLEFSGDVQLTRALRLMVDAGTLNARFGAFPGGGTAGADATGNRLPFAPRFSVSAAAEVTAPLPARAGSVTAFLRARHRTSVFTGQENDADERLAAATDLEGRLAWRPRNGRFEVALWGRNLLDAHDLTNRVRDFLGTRTVSRADPRTYGVEVSARF